MGHRRDRLDGRLEYQIKTRREKSLIKEKYHTRKDARMIEAIKKDSLPYTPEVMSWLSVKLDKKSSKITAEDIKKLI